jgi:hypothetical protein
MPFGNDLSLILKEGQHQEQNPSVLTPDMAYDYESDGWQNLQDQ